MIPTRLSVLILLALFLLNGCAGTPTQSGKRPDGPSEMERIGDEQYRQGRLREALNAYGQAIGAGASPEASRVLHLKMGGVLLSAKEWPKALTEYRAVLETAPDNVQALLGAGAALLELGNHAGAEPLFFHAASLRPDLALPHTLLGIALHLGGQYGRAEQEFRTALSLGDDRSRTLNNIGSSRMRAGDHAGAAEAFRQALAARPAPRIYNNLGAAQCHLQHYDSAFEAFSAAGDMASAYNNMGVFLLQQGFRDKAIEYFEKALETSRTFHARAAENQRMARAANDVAGITAAPAVEIPPALPLKIVDLEETRGTEAAGASPPAIPLAPEPVALAPEVEPDGRAEAPPAAMAPAGQGKLWYVLDSAWATRPEAEERARVLRGKGCEAVVEESSRGSGFRVLVGGFKDKARATLLRTQHGIGTGAGKKPVLVLSMPQEPEAR